MKNFYKRLASAIALATITCTGLYIEPMLFLALTATLAMYELNRHFTPQLAHIFALYSCFILYGIISFAQLFANFDIKYTIFLVVIVFSTDAGAYIFGSLIGGPKLIPSISPNKTISGLLLGSILGMICGLTYSSIYNLEIGPTITSLLVASSAIGDLIESYVKRRIGVKDLLNIIPGHGGILDRLDSIIPTAIILLGILRVKLG